MFDKNKILLGGRACQLHPPIVYEGLESMWRTASGDLYVHSKLDEDTDGTPPSGVVMDATHQDETSLRNPDGSSLNAFQDPFIVVPLGFLSWLQTQGIDVAMGAIGLVQYQGHCIPVIVGDEGPREKIGEASAYVREQLGFKIIENNHVIDCGIDSGVEWILFAGSGNGEGRPLEEIQRVAAMLSQRL